MKIHIPEDTCPGCEKKLEMAHVDLVNWFRNVVKPAHPDCHISWSFRDRASQDQAYAEGKSKLPWPESKHNSNPAEAIDLFELASNGMACWNWKYFKQIADEAKEKALPIRWGGDFKHLGDTDHFELN